MDKCMNGSCDIVKGIMCSCEKCTYHSMDNRCHADNVQIGPESAHSSSETVCRTFKCK